MKHALSSKQIVFRTDSSVAIGTGHVMRCLTFAVGLAEQGAQVQFLCRAHDGNLIDFIESRGFLVHSLSATSGSDRSLRSKNGPAHAAWLGCDWQTDAQYCRAILSGSVDWIIVDHYALDHRWESSMRDKCNHIMCIDDLADRSHDCDVLLDQNLGRTANDYRDFVNTDTRLLLGPQYALLRPEFFHWRNISLARRQLPELRHILVTLGGIDRYNVTGRVLKTLAQCRLTTLEQITVVLGSRAPWRTEVTALAADMQVTTTVLSDVQNMAELMTSSDLVIGAGGTTTWERCALGVPTIQLDLAPNQKFICQQVKLYGAIILCGVADLECELQNVLQIVSDPSCMKQLSMIASTITDGRGMQETLQVIKEL